MTIQHVQINNHDPIDPGGWWDKVKLMPDDSQINATITLSLSWNEYRRMLDENAKARTVSQVSQAEWINAFIADVPRSNTLVADL